MYFRTMTGKPMRRDWTAMDKVLGSYQILEKIGAGGMGEVYRARDTRLSREVAIKMLPAEAATDPEFRARFEREAKSLAALNHPGILTVHSIEQQGDCTFITMELVRGETLEARLGRGRLEFVEFLDLAISLCEALTAAHERGVVHRDLKPANVMLDEEGHPKILDFGLAKLLRSSGPSEATVLLEESLTRTGSVFGTPAYMAPEQIEGRNVDHRTDVFALGLILFRAAAGRPAFTGDSVPAVVSSILRDQPPSVSQFRPDWPSDVARIVGRCLEKDPRKRFQTARDVFNELCELRDGGRRGATAPEAAAAVAPPATQAQAGQGGGPLRRGSRVRWIVGAVAVLAALAAAALWLGPGRRGDGIPAEKSVPDRPMIAILPFENLGPPENAYFAAGITEEITSRLAAVDGLGVISRTSAVQYAGTAKSLREIGAELGADYVLEGTVRWAPGPEGRDRVRITPQLIRVTDDTHLWADRYDDVLDDVFAVQSQIARNVVRELGVALLRPEEEALDRKPTEDQAAYEAYLRALDAPTVEEMIRLLERAIELDPDFPEAWAHLSNAHASLYRYGGDQTPARLARADSTLARAVALAPENPEVLWAAAYTAYYGHAEYERALEYFRRLLDRNPSSARAYEGMGYIRRRQGRLAEAVSYLERAHRLDPRDANIVHNLARTWEARRRFPAADSLYRQVMALNPDGHYTARWASMTLEWTGDLVEVRRRLESDPDRPPTGLELDLLLTIGDYEQVIARSEAALGEPAPIAYRGAIHAIRAWALDRLGRTAESRAEAVTARDLFSGALEEGPGNAFAIMVSALNLLTLGEPEAALARAERAVELTAVDRFSGPRVGFVPAVVLAHAGRSAEAIRMLDDLLTGEYERPMTVPYLRKSRYYEALWGDPAFEELLQRHSGKESPES
jgi:TolB-like protein/Tfp pilus assembly protein PilF